MKIYFELLVTFMRIGAFTFGGGFAMIPLIEREIVDKKKWISSEEILNLFAVSQSVPGAVAINTSTLVGYKIAGRLGGIFATLGVIIPSFVIISVIAAFFGSLDPETAEPYFLGINGAVFALICMALVRMFRAAIYNKTTIVIYGIALVLIVSGVISPIFVILFSVLPGLMVLKFKPESALNLLVNKKMKGEAK